MSARSPRPAEPQAAALFVASGPRAVQRRGLRGGSALRRHFDVAQLRSRLRRLEAHGHRAGAAGLHVNVGGQSVLTTNWFLLTPHRLTVIDGRTLTPVFVTVTVRGALVVPTGTAPKSIRPRQQRELPRDARAGEHGRLALASPATTMSSAVRDPWPSARTRCRGDSHHPPRPTARTVLGSIKDLGGVRAADLNVGDRQGRRPGVPHPHGARLLGDGVERLWSEVEHHRVERERSAGRSAQDSRARTHRSCHWCRRRRGRGQRREDDEASIAADCGVQAGAVDLLAVRADARPPRQPTLHVSNEGVVPAVGVLRHEVVGRGHEGHNRPRRLPTATNSTHCHARRRTRRSLERT